MVVAAAITRTVVSDEQGVVLERWVGAQKTPQSVALRARIVLLAGEGESNSQIARALGVSRPTTPSSKKSDAVKPFLRQCTRATVARVEAGCPRSGSRLG